MLKKIVLGLLVVFALMSLTTALLAQEPAAGGAAPAGKTKTFGEYAGVLTAGFALALAVMACGTAQGRAVAAACEGVARNPGAAKNIQLFLILGLAFIESLSLYVLLIAFQALGK